MAELYRLTWRLSAMALYTAQFREKHHDTEDTRQSWEGLVGYVTEGWPPCVTAR